MPVKLALPQVVDTPDPEVEVRAVYVEEWVEGLAYANPPRLLEQLLENVRRLNCQPLRYATRMQLLDLHLAPFQFALKFRREQNPAMTGAALARQRALSRALRHCAVALSLGYKQALSEVSQRQGRFGTGRDRRTLLQRSTLTTALALMCCYDAYRPALQHLWLELTALYEFAAKQQGADRAVSAPGEDELFARSTDHIFKRACLTSLVDPYHLAYGELWRVFAAFGELADDARVLAVSEVPGPAGYFLIDPDGDHPPRPLSRVQGTQSRRCRLLDANAALARLEARHRQTGQGSDLPGHLVAAMIRALGLPPLRHTPRERSEGKATVSVGLSATHHFLSGGAARDTDPMPVTPSDEIEIGDSTSDLDFTASYAVESWNIVDEGPAGMGLLLKEPPRLPLGVGDLVGLQFPLRGDAPDEWSIAVVRWIHVTGNREHHGGLQILSPTAVPVMVFREELDDTVTRNPTPALALPGIRADTASGLVLSRGLFAPGMRLRTVDGNRSWLLQLGTRSETTGSFERFAYSILEGQ
jgi:hypothetical protein